VWHREQVISNAKFRFFKSKKMRERRTHRHPAVIEIFGDYFEGAILWHQYFEGTTCICDPARN